MGKKDDLSLSISETADLLGLSTESYQLFTEKGPEEKISSDQRFSG